MKYPKLKVIPTNREIVEVFKGYNHNLRIGSGEFYDMTNLSSDNYPVLSPRPKRGIYVADSYKPQGMIAKDSLCYVDDADFVINGYHVPMGLLDDHEPKTLISMGAYVIIMPDKKYINTADYSDYGPIEATVTTKHTVTFELCRADGVAYRFYDKQSDPPSNPGNMALWLDTSETPHQLKQYSTTTAMWSPITTTYIRIRSNDDLLGKPFSVNDGVQISGVESDKLSDLNASMVIHAKGDGYIVVTGIVDDVITQDKPITVARRMPNMDFIIESENRLWGCRYGPALNGELVNDICL